MILLLLLSRCPQAMATHAKQANSNNLAKGGDPGDVVAFLMQRMLFDPSLANNPAKQNGCQHIGKTAKTMQEKIPGSGKRLQLNLQRGLHFICATTERIQELIRDTSQHAGGLGSALFSQNDRAIFFTPETINEGLLNHEGIHADNFLSHFLRPNCRADPDSLFATFPLLYDRPEQLSLVTHALNRGDQRVVDFKELLAAVDAKKPLSKKQEERFKRYLNAAQSCKYAPSIVVKEELSLVHENIDDLRKAVFKVGGISYKIDKVENAGTHSVVTMHPADGISVVLTAPKIAAEKLANGYRKMSRVMQVIEREAYTFQALSEAAIEVFYPELHQLKLDDRNQCEGGETQDYVFNTHDESSSNFRQVP